MKNFRKKLSIGAHSGGLFILGLLGVVNCADGRVWTVKQDGTGDFTTIQAASNAAKAGDSCEVYSGIYPEHVKTFTGGLDELSRITFKAQSVVTMQGFDVKHPYVTIDGFDITGSTSYQSYILITSGGNYCRILNNTIRDGAKGIGGITIYISGGLAATGCTVKGNTLRNLLYMFLTTGGSGHTFENNIFERQNSMDYIRLFGRNHVFRRNIFREGNAVAGTGNHPDLVQTFGDFDMESNNMLFEENWIQDLESQLGQLNSQTSLSRTVPAALSTKIHDWTFKNNVFINVSNNMNVGIPGMKFINNTFYRVAYTGTGIGFGGSLKRGDASNALLKNNVFLALGLLPDSNGYRGYYALSGAFLSREVLYPLSADETIGDGIFDNMIANGYIDSNGGILSPAKGLLDISQFVINPIYAAYKEKVYDLLVRTIQLDASIRSTFVADYNYVSEGAPSYAAKTTHPGDPRYVRKNFEEIHGINGGDPKFQDVNNPLGPDGIPFTLDDGLKPIASSPLRGKGEAGIDIGAYSCDPTRVFPELPSATDSDGDGLVDSWEIQYFIAINDARAKPELDVDGDGLTNLEEQSAGTSPIDSKSLFTIISQSLVDTRFSVTWRSIPTKRYLVESSSNLVNWTNAASVDASSSSTTWVDLSASTNRKFYRIKLL